MLEIDGSIWLRAGNQTLGGQSRIDLLMHIEATGSITAAARAAGMSYKGAWDAINTLNNLAGEPLIVRSAGGKGGGGTRLTERARQLIASFNALQREHQRFLKHLAKVDLTVAKDLNVLRRLMLRTSARNQLPGTVTAIEAGAVNDEVTLCLAGGQTLVASLTHASAQELGLEPGKEAIALIKASSVMVGLPGVGMRLSARNQLAGTVSAVHPGAVNSEILIDLSGNGTLAAIITNDSARSLALQPGGEALAIFKASSVIVGVLD